VVRGSTPTWGRRSVEQIGNRAHQQQLHAINNELYSFVTETLSFPKETCVAKFLEGGMCMAKFVSFKLTNESEYWLVDLERGVVSTMNGPVIDQAEVIQTGSDLPAGIEMAFMTETHEDAFSGKYDK
jgi:hypothetical protein